VPRPHGKNWDAHVADLELVAAGRGFLSLRDQVLELARLSRRDTILDVGAGAGLLTLAAARHVRHVYALDASESMYQHLQRKLRRIGVCNAEALLGNATQLPLADGSVDAVVSNYCFHHLDDDEKAQALAETMRVLRPGGRFVFADMMFRVGLARHRDRAVLLRFTRQMLARGPAGMLRLLRNAGRVLARSVASCKVRRGERHGSRS
jgi:ubiquinone/menaquinone biosynthesis C-methylase UbiE